MRDFIVSGIIIALLLLLVVLVILSPGGSQINTPVPPEQLRKLAAALEAQGLYDQAVQEYSRYLEQAEIPSEQRANLLYNIGMLYLDEIHDYENALATFLRITNLYPQAPIARDADKRTVRCLEEMKRDSAAQRKLKQLTDLEPDEDSPGTGPVVAQIGDRKITRDQLERELDQLPESQKKYYDSPEKRRQFLQSKLMEELLYGMALRKEYNKDKEIRQQVNQIEKMLLAQKVMNEEVNQKVQIVPSDLETYYKANLDQFKTPASVRIAQIFASTQEKADEAKKAIDGGMSFEKAVQQYSEDSTSQSKGGVLGNVYSGNPNIPGVGSDAELVDRLLAMDENAVSDPVKTEQGYHLFHILQKTPEKQMALDEVKSRVEVMVRQSKAQDMQNELFQRLLKSEKVKIYDQSLIGSATEEQ